MALSSDRFRLGEWLVDPSLSRVTKDDKAVHLEPRAMEVLVYLAHRADELVPKQDLIDNVWQAEVVAQGSLTGIIAQLRNALCDNSKHPRYIETIHTKGYRLIAEVLREPTGPCPPSIDRRINPTQEAEAIRWTDRSALTSLSKAEAETGLLQTISRARDQGKKSAELRAATRLAGLLKEQDRIDEARALLRPIVARFGEGIDTLPLLEAKALLWDMTNTKVE